MSSQDVLPLSAEKRAQGYGVFPYVILRLHGGVYMQFPIHFYEEKNPEKPGLRVRVDSLTNEKQNFSSLFNVVRQFHQQINPVEAKALKMCLVLAPFVAYFFEDNAFTFSDEIPEGGSLIDANYKVLALNSVHFVTD
ncbi:MAG: hypothetical protein RLZZ382_1599 [Bacteroidota bacterium]|jgi:hypothetical protein